MIDAHICKYGRIRKYHSLLCSNHLYGEGIDIQLDEEKYDTWYNNHLNWEQKAQWLRKNGYNLCVEEINGGNPKDDCMEDRWIAHINGEHRTYGMSIPEVINRIYDAIV